MNERLQELARQAGISTTDHGRGLFIDDDVSLGDLERFAQLIVRECAAYAFSDDQDHKAMLNHFGVER